VTEPSRAVFLSYASQDAEAGVLADACRIAGRTSVGVAAVHSGLETAHSTKERFYEAELLRLEGELARATATEPERSVALFERALELARQQAAHLLELRALTSLAPATQDPRRTEELLRRISALLDQFTLPPESADTREARLLVFGSRANPAVIPGFPGGGLLFGAATAVVKRVSIPSE